MGLIRTGVFATEDELTLLKQIVNTPMIALQCGPTTSPQQLCHRFALRHGLQEIQGYYGVDFATGEFLRT